MSVNFCKKFIQAYAPFSAIFLLLVQAQGQTEIPQGGLTISVSGGMAPTFSWNPDSAIGRLVVEQGDKELWGTETEGTNTYHSPIRYGVHPPDALEDVPARAGIHALSRRCGGRRSASGNKADAACRRVDARF
jgi:hypothetical protein